MIAARLAAPAERRGWAISTLSMLALLYLLPGYLAHAEQHSQSLDRAIYISWWLAAGVVAVAAFAIRNIPRDLSLAYLLAPLTSRSSPHLLMANWVYHVDFHAANLGSILIATAASSSARQLAGECPGRSPESRNRHVSVARLMLLAQRAEFPAIPDDLRRHLRTPTHAPGRITRLCSLLADAQPRIPPVGTPAIRRRPSRLVARKDRRSWQPSEHNFR